MRLTIQVLLLIREFQSLTISLCSLLYHAEPATYLRIKSNTPLNSIEMAVAGGCLFCDGNPPEKLLVPGIVITIDSRKIRIVTKPKLSKIHKRLIFKSLGSIIIRKRIVILEKTEECQINIKIPLAMIPYNSIIALSQLSEQTDNTVHLVMINANIGDFID